MKKKFYTITEIAEMMSVSTATVFYWIRKKRLKGFRPSGPHGHLRFTESEIQNMISSGSSFDEKRKAGS